MASGSRSLAATAIPKGMLAMKGGSRKGSDMASVVWVHDKCWKDYPPKGVEKEVLTLGGCGPADCAICGEKGEKCKGMWAIWDSMLAQQEGERE
jgi:hypothetical protein